MSLGEETQNSKFLYWQFWMVT